MTSAKFDLHKLNMVSNIQNMLKYVASKNGTTYDENKDFDLLWRYKVTALEDLLNDEIKLYNATFKK